MASLARWAPRPPLPELLPGEDRSFGSGLFVDLVPESCWFTLARTGIAPVDWDGHGGWSTGGRGTAARREACRDPQAGARIEAHERWLFDDARGVQVLRRLICLCGACHGTTHFGLAQVQGRSSEALKSLEWCGSRAWNARPCISARRSRWGRSGPRGPGIWTCGFYGPGWAGPPGVTGPPRGDRSDAWPQSATMTMRSADGSPRSEASAMSATAAARTPRTTSRMTSRMTRPPATAAATIPLAR